MSRYDDPGLSSNHIVLKIHGGTSKNTARLCDSCRWAVIMRGANGEEDVVCNSINSEYSRIKFSVTECSRYSNKSKPSLSDMEEIAWRLVTKKSTQSIGFVDPREFRKEYKKEE